MEKCLGVDGGVPSALGFRITGSKTGQGEGRRYAHGFWGRHISVREFPQYSCDFWLSLMSGYGGNIVAFLPNGATFYIFSDGMEFPWANAVSEVAKLAPTCR